jgi:hypothetical protein
LGCWDIDLLMGVPGRSSGDGQRRPTGVQHAGTDPFAPQDPGRMPFLLVDVLIVFLFDFPANYDGSYARRDFPAISQPLKRGVESATEIEKRP